MMVLELDKRMYLKFNNFCVDFGSKERSVLIV